MMVKHSSPSNLLFMTTLFLSTIMMLSASNWIMLWVSMEMNMMSFIPIMLSSKKSYELEAAIKYFLVQAISSSTMLMSFFMHVSSTLLHIPSFTMAMSIMMKMGVAPFHMWMPQVMSSVSWLPALLIITWQKLGPLSMLSYLMFMWDFKIMTLLITMNAVVGSLGGINQTQMRPLIAYSSISHMAWMLTSLLTSPLLTMLYFFMYTLISLCVIIPIMKLEKTSTHKFNMITQFSFNQTNMFILNLLSLGGMPPLMGFIPKWLVISSMIHHSPLLIMILVLSSLVSLYFYMKICFALALNSTSSMKLNNQSPATIYIMLMITIPTILLMFTM